MKHETRHRMNKLDTAREPARTTSDIRGRLSALGQRSNEYVESVPLN
jgi:hypothetical protein